MTYKGAEIVSFMESQLGNRGAQARAYCGLGAGEPWCNAEVDYAAYKCGVRKLLFDGRKETYCPNSIKWCYRNLACIPIYIALEGDVIYFDWEGNGNPNHIGFVRQRVSDIQIDTVEGNTSGGKVDNKIRPLYGKYNGRKVKQIQGVFRPHYTVPKDAYDVTKKLEVDGLFGFNSIAGLQKALCLPVTAILDKATVKALQKMVGVDADGDWGVKTTKAVQKMVGAKVDGYCGAKTVKALQKWINKINSEPINKPSKTLGDKIADTAKSYVGKVPYVKGGTSLKTGVDCTGFIQAVYGKNGIKLSPYLKDWGKSIGTDLSKAKPGDIVTYDHHHAIYLGDGKVCHAANKKDGVIISKSSSIGQRIKGIRRRWK